jgi:AraC-like DNA-binding protein
MIGHQLSLHRGCRLFVSEDLDDVEARISTVMQPHKLHKDRATARLTARMSFLRLSAVGVGTIAFGRMGLRIDKIEDYHLLIFCMHGHARVHSGRAEFNIGGTRGVCLAPGEPVHALFSEDCEQLVFRINASTMRRNSAVSDPALRQEIDLSSALLQPWVRLTSLLIDDVSMIDLVRRDERIAAHYERLFVSTLLDGQGAIEEGRHAHIAPAAVKRAEAYIDEHLADPLNLGDIADAAGVPVRTLLLSFAKFRSISPMRYLRDRRLDWVHFRLMQGDPALTVSKVALEAGFTHLSRFSQAYRARFGESPSIELRHASHRRIA